jgi:hypothetical protein
MFECKKAAKKSGLVVRGLAGRRTVWPTIECTE